MAVVSIGSAAAPAGVNPAPATPQPRLVRAAHEFEAQMMKELLKPMTGSSSLTGDDDEQGSNGALGEFASDALGRALSERGGFGIADSIVKELSSSGNHKAPGNHKTTPAVTKVPHGDTAMSIHK